MEIPAVNKKLVIAHANCIDGLTCAWLYMSKWGPDTMDVIFAKYGEAPPADVVGREVHLLDFTYKRDHMLKLVEDAASVFILDHHASAEKDLAGIMDMDKVGGEFNKNFCGAALVWKWLHHPTEFIPPGLPLVQDRDLGTNQIAGSREYHYGLQSIQFSVDHWNEAMYNPAVPVSIGSHIVRWIDLHVIPKIVQNKFRLEIGDQSVPAVNCPRELASDVCHILADGEPFAAAYYDEESIRHYELRSRGVTDVGAIATRLGGGGHPNAAGFRSVLNRTPIRFPKRKEKEE